MAFGDILLRSSADDEWSDGIMMLILLLLGLSTLFISANLAFQDIMQVNYTVFLGIMIVTSIIALQWRRTAKAGSMMDFVGLRSAMWAGLGIALGIIIYTTIILARTAFDPSISSADQAGNVLPFGAIGGVLTLQNVNYFDLVVFAPLVETIFFVGVVFPTMLLLVKKFEFTRRLAALSPFTVFILLITVNALLFASYHLYAYEKDSFTQITNDLAQGKVFDIPADAVILNVFIGKLITIWFLSLVWIATMQLTRSLSTALTMHILMNWFALGSVLTKMGKPSVGIIDLLLWVLVPLLVVYGISKVLTPLLPKARVIRG
jgi:hypothetical protein